MKHTYELKRLNNDDRLITVLNLEAEPKYAKEKAKDYTKQHPGIYLLQRIDTVAGYFTEKELDKNA